MWIYDSNFNLSMISIKLKTIKKDFIVSKIEASQDGIPPDSVAFTDPDEPKSAGGGENSCYPVSLSVIVMKQYQKWR